MADTGGASSSSAGAAASSSSVGAASSSSAAAAGTRNNIEPPFPLDGGAFLLHLLQNPPQTPSAPQPRTDAHHHQRHHFDPAVAAFGPGHLVLPHELFNPHHHHHSPLPPPHLPPGHFGDPPHLLQSLPLHLQQPFRPGLWSQAPLGFPPLGLDGPPLNHHIFHLERQRLGLATPAIDAGGMARAASTERIDLAGNLPRQGYGEMSTGDQVTMSPGWNHPIAWNQEEGSFLRPPPGFTIDAGGMARAASTERIDLAGNLPRQGYSEMSTGDQVTMSPGWNHPVAWNQEEGSFLRPPPGFRHPQAGRGTEYDRVSTSLGGQESRLNWLNPQAEKSTASIGQSNHSHDDRGRGAASSPWQRKLAEPGKQYSQASGQPTSGHWATKVEREDARPSQDNNQTHSEKPKAHGVLHIGDVAAKRRILFGEIESTELLVGSGPPADGQLSVAEHFDEESEHDSEDDADLSTVERMESPIGDEYTSSAEQSTSRELDELCEETASSLKLMVKKEAKSVMTRKNRSRDKDFRCDLSRGHFISSMRVRIQRRTTQCRHDIDAFSPYFLSIFESLIPTEEEKAKQKQLLLTLEKLINNEWPNARLYLYGSCANSFGVSKSDIDVCLSIDYKDINKIDILLKLAEILESGNLQNVQALTRARVPIVKLMDPVTGLSCDICINNLLAVVNTRLLKDYSQIDHRLRELAFIVKHWARSRRVNETYQGTLSSYAYVLMCIHFLQLRQPAVLPCLQAMEATFAVTVDNTLCSYFDRVERFQAFGSRNKESIARLLWGFFNYWAYHHDYMNDVISVRTGSIISKQAKDWIRRIGNDRHLICIEDPFETSHDLGRVVDKHSIKILREEFERAANILQFNANPAVTLFEPYIRPSPVELVQ